MKAFGCFLLSLFIPISTWGQGTIVFGNRIGTVVNAPIFDIDCSTPLPGPTFVVQAYVGPSAATLQPLGPVVEFLAAGAAGYFPRIGLIVPFAQPNVPFYGQIRAWEASAGASYEAAMANGGKHGFSNLLLVEAGFGTPSPPNALGLESFCLIPEPRVYVLVLLGALLCCRWIRVVVYH